MKKIIPVMLASTVLALAMSACGGGGGGSSAAPGASPAANTAGTPAVPGVDAPAAMPDGGLPINPVVPAVPVVPSSPAPVATTCLPSSTAKTWEVGPGLAYPTVGDVDWNQLAAGDVVRIHWKATPYAEKILISTSGTVAKPIRVCGVTGGPNAGDSLQPVITGENATTRADLAFQNDQLTSYVDDATGYPGVTPNDKVYVLEPLGLVTVQNKQFEKKPANIIIEGLHLTGANQYTSFTSAHGKKVNHIGFSACIRVQKGDNIVIRGNEIENCGHAIFALSRDNESQTSRNLLIEHNYIHGNGAALPLPSGQSPDSVHAIYVQTIGLTVQFNYFGHNRAGSPGGIVKSRSVGDVIRYNWFEQGPRIIDLVEPQDYDTSIFPDKRAEYALQQPQDTNLPSIAQVAADFVKFQTTYVYGNFIRNDYTGNQGAYGPVHFGGDQYVKEIGRRGTLYFFNNTLVTLADYADASRLNIFDMGTGSNFTKTAKIAAFNNVIHLQSKIAGSQRPDFFLARHTFENLDFANNWITSDAVKNGTDDEAEQAFLLNSGVITGFAKCASCTVSPVNTTTLISAAGNAALINKAKALPPELAGLTLDFEFKVNHANPLLSTAAPRAVGNLDIGAAAVAP